jgi:uncharacterized protein YegL
LRAGDVQVQIIAFSSTATSYGPFTSLSSFETQVDALNPLAGGTRPFNGGTDFTAAVQETMSEWDPISGWNNQVFFISDGNPTEQTGSGGNSLTDATATVWNTFVDSKA